MSEHVVCAMCSIGTADRLGRRRTYAAFTDGARDPETGRRSGETLFFCSRRKCMREWERRDLERCKREREEWRARTGRG